jgi:hypothetical protein
MLNPDDILDKLVALWRDIPALVSQLGDDSANIIAYKVSHDGSGVNLEQRFIEMERPKLMVCLTSIDIGSFAKLEAIKHSFAVYIRAGSGNYVGPIIQQVVDGVVAAQNRRFRFIQVDPNLNPIERFSFAPRTFYIAPQFGTVDFAQATFVITERGLTSA